MGSTGREHKARRTSCVKRARVALQSDRVRDALKHIGGAPPSQVLGAVEDVRHWIGSCTNSDTRYHYQYYYYYYDDDYYYYFSYSYYYRTTRQDDDRS